jgi:hypothetical protein
MNFDTLINMGETYVLKNNGTTNSMELNTTREATRC